jgi:DNA polymerase-3 subunit alpha
MLSNAVTNIDSVTTYKQYIEKAKACGMTAMAFSEHGNIFEWVHKKDAIEAAGMKYIHAMEAYLTERIPNEGEEKIRDNYHCVLIARNWEGVKELNVLQGKAFNRVDGHYYYAPRITFAELFSTSNNIIITTACVASALCRGTESAKESYLRFLTRHKDRCFLEVQHHNTQKQFEYNRYLASLSRETGLRLIAGTDTHCLNAEHELGRSALQRGKGVFFDDEVGWDLTWKTYDELVEAYRTQDALSEEEYMSAINNTNVMADMIEPFELDRSFKYAKIYEDGEKVLREKLFAPETIDPIIKEGFSKEEVTSRLEQEIDTFKALNATDFILLEDHIVRWEHSHDMWQGPARGSAASSLALYALGVTEVNPLKYGFYFWRFMDKSKYSLADVDMDNSAKDRDKLKFWMLNDHLDLPNVKTCEIITFNTIALKGAIRDIGRGLDMPLDEVDTIAKAVHEVAVDEEKIVTIDDSWRKKYPELFKYVDIVIGTIVSIGSHPSGVVVSDHDIESEFGLCYLKDDPYPVSCINMKELDSLNFTKQDALGLDNVGIINETCKLAGIERLSPKTIDFEDDAVWNSIKEDTSLIFQMNSNYGQRTVDKMLSPEVYNKIKKQIPNMTRLDLLTFINALIRPCGKGVYDDATNGIVSKTGIREIDDLLGSSMGYAIMQEPQMAFVQEFCGYDFLRADKLRKIIGKKLGTRDQLPIIKEGWEKNAKVKYHLTDEQSDKIINPFLQCILDATRYSFSLVHSLSYSCISYECAYLRYHYPLQYLTSCLNAWNGDDNKTAEAIEYANSRKVKILAPKFRHAKAEYFYDLTTNSIYKGTSSIKGLNAGYSDFLYSLKDNSYKTFTDLLYDIQASGMPRDQVETLIKLDYFEEFGTCRELATIFKQFQFFKKGEAKTIAKSKIPDEITMSIIKRNANETEKQFNKLNCHNILNEIEQYIMTMNLGDVDIKTKIANQLEYMGYIGIKTDKSEDRPKIVILEMKVMKQREAVEPWGVIIDAQSIGSGKRSSYTIPYKLYKKCKFNKNDVIKIRDWYKNKRGYFYITDYEFVVM